MMAMGRRRMRDREPDDPGLAAHQRQLDEIDSLAARGVLAPAEAEGARNEAGRRLLSAAAQVRAEPRAEGAPTRLAALTTLALAPLLALALYLTVGLPGAEDQPFAGRVAAWRRADPATLGPQQLAAVLEQATRERPEDWRAAYYLGQASLAGGDSYAALRAFDRARRLAPREAGPLEGAGEALVSLADGRVDADAQRAFEAALRLNPHSVPARFQLGRARLAAGDRDGALRLWREAVADLPAADPRRQLLASQIAETETPASASADAATDGLVQNMVASLAARLERAPDDPQGWARLIRSYRVLGDQAAANAALARARSLFTSRPDALAIVEQQSR